MTEAVVDTEWVEHNVSDPGVTLVDVRPPFFFAQGHIPGAVNLPQFFLSSPRGGPPPPEQLAGRLGELGITRGSHIVAYDDGASTGAGRLFWVLSYYRHPRVSVLDGGVTLWRHEGRDWEYESAPPVPAECAIAQPDGSVIVHLDEMLSLPGAPDTVVLDVRTPGEFLGVQPSAARDGHIPGAVNVDWVNMLERQDGAVYRLRPEQALRELYETAGATPDKRVVVYCHSGQRAAVSFAVLKDLGYAHVSVYSPGWQEWGNRGDTPIERA